MNTTIHNDKEIGKIITFKVALNIQTDRSKKIYNSFLASGYFCSLLLTFTNSLDQDQDLLFMLSMLK